MPFEDNSFDIITNVVQILNLIPKFVAADCKLLQVVHAHKA